MWEEGSVFGCYTSMWDVIYYSELGSSWAVLAAGYTIDCLMIRYQNVDWTDLDSWDCNSRYACLIYIEKSYHEAVRKIEL